MGKMRYKEIKKVAHDCGLGSWVEEKNSYRAVATLVEFRYGLYVK